MAVVAGGEGRGGLTFDYAEAFTKKVVGGVFKDTDGLLRCEDVDVIG